MGVASFSSVPHLFIISDEFAELETQEPEFMAKWRWYRSDGEGKLVRKVVMFSETGECRRNNQDAVMASYTEQAGIFAVADGMGGHYKGEIASQQAVALLQAWWEDMRECILSVPFLDMVLDLEKRVREINESVYQTYQRMGQRGGTTLCVLVVCRDAYAVLNIGDSRLYRRQGRECVQVTIDDVWENQNQIRQTMTIEDIRKNPSYGRLIQALGAAPTVKISVRSGCLKKKSCFFLCSDGVYKYCDETRLFKNLRKIRNDKDVEVFAEKMKQTVCENGAGDNFSLIAILLDRSNRIFMPGGTR